MMRRRAFLSAAIGTLSGTAVAGPVTGAVPSAVSTVDAPAAPRQLYHGLVPAFGAVFAITVMHGDVLRAQQAIDAALLVVQDVERLTAIGDDGSAVSRLNREGSVAQPEAALVAMLAQACALSELTGGAFDVTVQPLLRVFADAQHWGAMPEQHHIDQARALVGWRRLAVGRHGVRFLQSGMALTLDGLAQGYAADMALAVLRRHGIRDALVDTGELVASGDGTQSWQVGLPDGGGMRFAAVPLRERCMATAVASLPGAGGVVDPVTGEAASDLARVTVLAPLGVLADGLSTALMVMGAKKAHALAARLPGIDILTMDRQGSVRRSAGFDMAGV